MHITHMCILTYLRACTQVHKEARKHACKGVQSLMGAGVPSKENSHPHVSDDNAEFTVVHNGILTNYKFLKEFLVGVSHPYQLQVPGGVPGGCESSLPTTNSWRSSWWV